MDYYKLGWRRWYWRLDDGRVFSGEKGDYVPDSDPDYASFTSLVIGEYEDENGETVQVKRQPTRMDYDGELALRLVHAGAPREAVRAAGLSEVGKCDEGLTVADLRAVLVVIGCEVDGKTYPIDPASEDYFASLRAGLRDGAVFLGYLRDVDGKKVPTQAPQAAETLSAILAYADKVNDALDVWKSGGEWKNPIA